MGGGVLEPEVDSDGGEHAVFEAVVGVSAHECGFADCGLSEEANFEDVVVVPVHLVIILLISLYKEKSTITVGLPAIGIATFSAVSTRGVP